LNRQARKERKDKPCNFTISAFFAVNFVFVGTDKALYTPNKLDASTQQFSLPKNTAKTNPAYLPYA